MAVSEDLKAIISMTIEETLTRTNTISQKRQKAVQDEHFKNTEKLLYSFSSLREHVADEKEYLDMLNKQRSGSIIRYSKNRAGAPDKDHVLESRMLSYNRSRSELERVAMALEKIKDKQGYEVIEMHYLQRKEGTDETYTFEEIADILSGKPGYGKDLNEKAVRNYKNTLIHELAILLFGAAAI